MNPLLGITYHAIGGFAAGSFYLPLKQIKKWSWESGWLVNGFGYHREFQGGKKDRREIMNWWAQSHVAWILWRLLVPIHEMAKSYGGHLAFTLYDELTTAIPDEHVRAAARAQREIMQQPLDCVAPGYYPRVGTIRTGKNWRDLKPLELTA